MTPAQFKAALNALGWTYREAAEELQVANHQRVSEWANGHRPVPPYIAAHLETRQELVRCREELPE